MKVKELIELLQKENPEADLFDTDAHPVIGLSHDDPPCGCCPLNLTVYIETEF